jgi:hypothetical protein
LGGGYDVFLFSQVCNQDPPRRSSRVRRDARVPAISLLDQNDQGSIRLGTLFPEVTVSKPGDQMEQPPVADPDIPAENDQSRGTGAGGALHEIERDRLAHIATPPLEP